MIVRFGVKSGSWVVWGRADAAQWGFLYVETLTDVPLILANGADWYKPMGTADSAGVKIFSLSGRVRKPGNEGVHSL